MKKCDHFKDLILTNYIDGELVKSSAESVENHLLDCGDCRAFFKEVRNVTLPLKQDQQQQVPVVLWDTIRQRIEDEGQAASPVQGFFDRLKGLLVFPRLVPVFASLALMLLAGSVTLNTIQVRQTQAKDQGEYLVSLLTPTGSSAPDDLGTPIEHYFL